jgi:tellurite resistance protein TerC
MPPAVIRSLSVTYRVAKRIAIGIVGGSVLLIGILMIVLPGPAFVVIPLGLGILGLEFAWARGWLQKAKDKAAALARGPKR